jgi:hypothetical protein
MPVHNGRNPFNSCFARRVAWCGRRIVAANLEITMEAVMPVAQKAAIATVSPRAFIFKHAALFAAAALFVFVLSLTYRLDLSPGFF